MFSRMAIRLSARRRMSWGNSIGSETRTPFAVAISFGS